jgi:hypothetical protein
VRKWVASSGTAERVSPSGENRMSRVSTASERPFSGRMRGSLLVLALLLVACLRNSNLPDVPREDDGSIVFPQFFEHEAVGVGRDAGTYELDGALLRAMTIAARDFSSTTDGQPCWEGRGTRYRVIRQGEIIFVYAYQDLAACGLSFAVADSGVKYAISAEGRLLRRVVDGEPLAPVPHEPVDGGPREAPAELGTSAEFDAGVPLDGGL